MLTRINSTDDADSRYDITTDKIIYIGPRRAFPECLIQAVESKFSDIEIGRVDGIEAFLDDTTLPSSEMRLVLVHDRLVESCLAHRETLEERYPDLDVAIVCTGQPSDKLNLSVLLQCDRVKGLLPFNLPLDVWLSALQLMLSGGEYVSKEHIDLVRPPAEPATAPKANRNRPKKGRGKLTKREQDVIELVAEGLQNKLIAARLGLSEHTVKLHIHNIISKLGAHNRTQAAAIYFGKATSKDG